MDAWADFNIVDHYYYPDSDLETIQEESSVLDSEDDRSIRSSSRRSSSSTITSSKLDETEISRRNKHALLFHGNNRNAPHHRNQHGPTSNSATYESYNGFNEIGHETKGSAESFSHQKIIYAKCLTGNESQNEHFSPEQAHNGVREEDKAGTITDMFEAARLGKLTMLRTFSASELSDTVDESGNTPLHSAAEHGHLGCIKLLVSQFQPHMVTLPNDDLMTATALAIKHNHLECVQWLLRHSSARDELTISHRTSTIDGSTTRPPLAHVAARFDRCEILDWLCGEMSRDEIGIDVGDHCSNTPVHVAAHYGHLRPIQILVARGASVTALNSDGNTPGQAARRHGHDTTVGYLVVVETCVSLAQQLVALRNEVEGLKTENVKLKKGPKNSSFPRDSSVSAEVSIADPESADGRNKEEEGITPLIHEEKLKEVDASNKRRTLQEQPPPPKLWNSSLKQQNRFHGSNAASIKGHTAVISSQKLVKSQGVLQRKIDEALKGPGTMVDGEVSNNMRVSDVDHPMTSSENMTSKRNPSKSTDINNEVETITDEISPIPEKKPWEKLTMDEMLRRVRDIRYQPSPSISLCTEDSTMESVEMMKERMAAASRWFLVEKGMEKPKHSTVVPHRHKPKVMEKKSHGHPLSPPYQGRADLRRIANKPLALSTPSHTDTKMQNAIQEHYQLTDHEKATSRANEKKLATRPPQPITSPDIGTSQQPIPVTSVPSGTLKFMVSHSKKMMKKDNPNQDSNPYLPITPSMKTVSDSSPTSPVGSIPAVGSTQRNNSYRRAVQVSGREGNKRSPENDANTTTSTAASFSQPAYTTDVRIATAKKQTIASRKDVEMSEPPSKQKSDPLQKRTGKEVVQGPMWTHLQATGPINKPVPVSMNGNYKNIENIAKREIKEKPAPSTPRYNQWTIPRVNKIPVSAPSYSRFADDETEGFEVSEVPELKAEIPSRQSSFLRRVQGKLR